MRIFLAGGGEWKPPRFLAKGYEYIFGSTSFEV